MAVAEAQQLGQEVEADVEEGVEANDPHEYDGRRQLEHALHKRDVPPALPRDLWAEGGDAL